MLKIAKIFRKVLESFTFTSWGTINWDHIREKQSINTLSEIFSYLKQFKKKFNDPIYIIWGEDDLPVIVQP